MKHKILSFIMAIIVFAAIMLLAVSCSKKGLESATSEADTSDEIVIGFSQLGAESDWRSANTESLKNTFTEEKGYKLLFEDGQQKQVNQIMAIRTFIQQEVDYIVLAPIMETGWNTVLQEATDAGIPVIIVDRMVDTGPGAYVAWVGSDFELEGKKAVAWLENFLKASDRADEEINIVHIQGTIGATAQIGRTKALNDGVAANENWNLLEAVSGEYTQAKAKEVMQSFLNKYDDIDVVYCENDNEAFGAIEAIEEAGLSVGNDGDIIVMSFDATENGLKNVLRNRISCNTECNPLLGERVEQIIKLLQEGKEPQKLTYVEESIFVYDDLVESVSVEGQDYSVEKVSKRLIESRKY